MQCQLFVPHPRYHLSVPRSVGMGQIWGAHGNNEGVESRDRISVRSWCHPTNLPGLRLKLYPSRCRGLHKKTTKIRILSVVRSKWMTEASSLPALSSSDPIDVGSRRSRTTARRRTCLPTVSSCTSSSSISMTRDPLQDAAKARSIKVPSGYYCLRYSISGISLLKRCV